MLHSDFLFSGFHMQLKLINEKEDTDDKKKRYLAAKMGLLALGLMLLFPGQAEAADKKTIYNSPYVSFSPDGKAFTTCAGDQNYTWYAEDDSTTVYSGIKSSLRSLRTGEHYYKVARWGEVPVGSWKVVHRPGQCIHDGYTSDENWHGIQFGTQNVCSIIILAGRHSVPIVGSLWKTQIYI